MMPHLAWTAKNTHGLTTAEAGKIVGAAGLRVGSRSQKLSFGNADFE